MPANDSIREQCMTVDVLVVDKPTINGNVYPRDVMERAVAEYKTKIGRNGAWGYLGDTPSEDTEAFVVADVDLVDRDDGSTVVEVLCAPLSSTPAGQALVQHFLKPTTRFGLVGWGDISEDRVITGYEIGFVGVAVAPAHSE